ncbi:MAG: glycosyltransferase family 2 protein [Vicinamibacterales bacterium]
MSVVIPVLNDARRLDECLRSLGENDCALEVLVIDNGSTDTSVAVARARGATVVVRPHGSVGALRNEGARMASASYVAFVDADHRVGRGWAEAALEVLRAPAVGAAGAPYQSEGNTWVQRTYDGLRRHRPGRQTVSWLGSGNMIVRRAAFEAIGGFDERIHTCEDVDLCRRLRAAGWVIVSDSSLVSTHSGDPATLRGVFLGELWRGRDNLFVSVRRPWDARAIASALVPAMSLSLAAASLVAAGGAFFSASAASVALLGVPVLLRTCQICAGRNSWNPVAVGQGIAVSACFEAGRALALVARAGHRRRRGGGADQSVGAAG